MQEVPTIILSIKSISKKYISISGNEIIALDNITLDIRRGEFVAVIGKNGCGKSTLLKTISGISKPTLGKIELYGSLTAINDLGTGVEPEISGYDNIKMIGGLHRMNKEKLRELKGFVEEFSELGERLNEPVKNYSQGMYLRLAFSINAFLNSDILIFDEILAVGDIQFRKKCFALLEAASEQGKTILIATHNFEEIAQSCSRCIWLNNGRVEQDDTPNEVYPMYLKFLNTISAQALNGPQFKNLKPEVFEIKKIYFTQNGNESNDLLFWDTIEINIDWEKKTALFGITFTLFVSTAANRAVVVSLSDNYGLSRELLKTINKGEVGIYKEVATLPEGMLNIGSYNLHIYVSYFTNEDDYELTSYSTHPVVFNVIDDEKQHEEFIWKYSQAPIRLKNTFKRIFVNS